MDHPLRRRRLAARLPELEVDALLVTRPANVRFLTGFTGSNAQLLLAGDGGLLFTDFRYEEQVRHEAGELEARIYRLALHEELKGAVAELGISRLGFEEEAVTYAGYRRMGERLEGVELRAVGPEVERLRWVKEAAEIERIQRAQDLTDDAFDRVTGKLAEGMTEREVALELELAMRQAGAEGLSFDTIVAFGENAAEPHHRPGERQLRRGDLVKMDFGALHDGYHADMTRTVAFGHPGEELREIYEIVRRAQRAGEEAVRPGATGEDADAAARRVIEEAGHGPAFGHSLGHGVGLDVHEGPTLRKGSDDVLPEGAVVTVEPGIYLPGTGGVRIEDMVVVTAEGCRPMPRTTKELLVL